MPGLTDSRSSEEDVDNYAEGAPRYVMRLLDHVMVENDNIFVDK